jgi:invasion protein IalB
MHIRSNLAVLLSLALLWSGSAHAQGTKSKTAPPQAAQPAAPAAQPQADTAPTGWAARCTSASRDAPLECAIEQNAVLTKTGQLIALINIRVPADTRAPVAR